MTIYKSLIKRNSFFPNQQILFSLTLFFLTITAFCAQKAASQTNEYEKWLGSYTFDDKVQAPKRRNRVDVLPVISYDINIEEGVNGKPTATFSENGVQRFQAFECSVKANGDKIEFYYEKFAADGVKDLSKFRKGNLLFSLVETQVGKTTKYLFQPAAYKILRYEKIKQKQPVYFEKQ